MKPHSTWKGRTTDAQTPAMNHNRALAYAIILVAVFAGGCALGNKMAQALDLHLPSLQGGASGEPFAGPKTSPLAAPVAPPSPAPDAGPTAGQAVSGLTSLPTVPDSADQITLLFVGVNTLESASPRLEAVWLAFYRPPARRVFVLGLPPASLVNLEGFPPMRLQEAFELGGENGLFLQALQSLVPVSPTATITLDRVGFSQVLDGTAGADLGGQHLSGGQALAWLDARSAAGPIEAVAAQAELLRGMVESARARAVSADPFIVLATAPDHTRSSHSPDDLRSLVSPALPLMDVEILIQGTDGYLALSALPGGEAAVVLNP